MVINTYMLHFFIYFVFFYRGFILVIVILLAASVCQQSGGKRGKSSLRPEIYGIVRDLVRGTYSKPCKSRTRDDKAAIAYYGRYRNRLGLKDQRLMLGE